MRNGEQSLIVAADRNSLEVFASDGLTYVPMPVQPATNALNIQIRVSGDPVHFKKLDVH